MTNHALRCPVCGKPLSQEEFDKALGLWDSKQQHIHDLEAEREKLKHQEKLNQQKIIAERRKFQEQATKHAEVFKREQAKLLAQNQKALDEYARKAEQHLKQQQIAVEKKYAGKLQAQVKEGIEKGVAQQKSQLQKQQVELRKTKNKMAQLENSLRLSADRYEQANAEIKRLKEQINKGITPQIEGLLEEDILLQKLVELYPGDRFTHTGKGGDVVQVVVDHGREVGTIVYECKRVKKFDKKHVEQANTARNIRKADFAVLVTNAFPSKKGYYFVERTVFVISPVSLEPITYTLRDSLVRIALLKMSNEAKNKAVQQVYEYLSSTEYSNKVNDIASQLLGLRDEIVAEITAHKRIWEKRYKIYRCLYSDVACIDRQLKYLVQTIDGSRPKQLPEAKVYPTIVGLHLQ